MKKFNQFIKESISNISVKNIGTEYNNELYSMIKDFNTDGDAYIGLFIGNKLIGGILLDSDYLPWEYRFDVVIHPKYRGNGYLKLLIERLIEKFNNDPIVDQLAATVVNKKLTKILVHKFNFNLSEYEGDDFVFINK